VLGNVYSGGNVTLTGRVRGNVQAAGTIVGTGTVDGSRAQYSPPPPVQAQAVPTFTWDATVYPADQNLAGHPPTTDLTPAQFQQLWADNKNAFRGHYRVRCSPCADPLTLDAKWAMTGDVTIVSDAPVTMSREMDNGAGGAALTLTVASLAAASPAILLSNSISPPDSIKVALFAPNGSVSFQNRKDFSGAVYAASMSLEQQFTLTYVPVVVEGFTWDLASSSHFVIQSRVFREVPVS
jgi:hypothetical protein